MSHLGYLMLVSMMSSNVGWMRTSHPMNYALWRTMGISLEDTYRHNGDESLGFDTHAIGEITEKMGARCGELVAADELAVAIKLLFDAVVMEDGQDDGGFAS